MTKTSANTNTIAWFSVFFTRTDKGMFVQEVRGYSAHALGRVLAKLQNDSRVTWLSATWGTADDLYGKSAEWVF